MPLVKFWNSSRLKVRFKCPLPRIFSLISLIPSHQKIYNPIDGYWYKVKFLSSAFQLQLTNRSHLV
jgi:hypothetical protein